MIHHSTLCSSVNWSSLYTRRKTHWLMHIYKTLLGLTPPYMRYLLQPSSSTYNTSSASHILLKVSKAHTSLGRSSFQFAADSDWNELKQTLRPGQFYLNLFIQRLNHGYSYWQVWLLCVMYCYLYLTRCAVVCAQQCLYRVLSCYHVVLLPCCCHVVLLPCCVVLDFSLCSVVLSLLS